MTITDRRRALMGATIKHDYFPDNAPYFKLGNDLSTNGMAAQGCCYHDGKIFFITLSSNAETQYLYTYDLVSGTLSQKKSYAGLGHANSMTYVPSENAFYIATMDKDIGIAVIDETTYDVTKTIVIYNSSGSAIPPWAIAFDRKHNVLYSRASETLVRVYDANGILIRDMTLTGGVTHATAQGMETDGKYIYYAWSGSNYIDVYSILSGKYVKTISVGFSKEFEEPAYDWDGVFYGMAYSTSGKQQIYSLLLRSFDGWLNMSYTPVSVWHTGGTGGTTAQSGYKEITFKSTASAGWAVLVYGAGYPYGYNYLHGKRCKFSLDVTRIAGSSGRVLGSAFTTNSNDVSSGSGVIVQGVKGFDIPASGYFHYEYVFVPGETTLLPSPEQEGTYVGYRIFLNADSGNQCKVNHFMFSVEV